jgi:hypothetical protein
MFEDKMWYCAMILMGIVLIGLGAYVPGSFYPPVVNLLLGIYTVIYNSVRLGMCWNNEEEEV